MTTELRGLELDNMDVTSFLLGAAFGISMLSFLESIATGIRTQQVTAKYLGHMVFDLLAAGVALTLVIKLL